MADIPVSPAQVQYGAMKAGTNQLVAISSPLVEGTLLIDKAQLGVDWFNVKVKEYAAKVGAYTAVVDAQDHMLDAYRYGLGLGSSTAYPAPPPTPPGLTPEQHAAHLAIHDLISAEGFEEERGRPGFVQINAHWGANGKRRFCCDEPLRWERGVGFVNQNYYFQSVTLNDAWMAKIEAPEPRPTTWKKLKDWLNK